MPGVFFLPRPRVKWPNLAAYGLLIGAGQFGLLFFAMDGRISPGLASLMIQTQVFFTIFLSMARVGERLRGFQVVACLLAVAGIGVIMLHLHGGTTTLFGLLLVLLAASSWAVGNIVARESGARNALAYVVWSSLFAAPPLLLVALLRQGPAVLLHAITHATPAGWVAVIWQSVGNSWFGYGSWAFLLARYPSATVSPMALLCRLRHGGVRRLAWRADAGMETGRRRAGHRRARDQCVLPALAGGAAAPPGLSLPGLSLPGLSFGQAAPNAQARIPCWAKSRFSASSNTTDCGPSITPALTSSPRWAGRQCMKIASAAARAISASSTR